MNQDWAIKPCGTGCSRCNGPFQDRQPYMSRLSRAKEGYDRADFCDGCWPLARQDDAAATAVSVWKGLYHPPPPPPEEALKKETAESLLRSMMTLEDEAKRNAMYVLAAMLERKRILVERSIESRPDGGTAIVYEHRRTGEVFVIPDPGLRLGQLEAVQEEVATLLGMKRPQDEAAQPGPGEPAAAPPDDAVGESDAE